MESSGKAGIRYLMFDSLAGTDVIHAVIARHGGTSPDPWRSLNIGGTVGDDPHRVRENLRLSVGSFGLDLSSVYDVWQVHGVDVSRATAPRLPGSEHHQADIITTNTRGVTLLMRFADCVPIILVDPKTQAIALVHAGWRGTLLGAARRAVESLQETYRSNPKDILAGIGPSICARHYEVGLEVVDQARQSLGKLADDFCFRINGSYHFDLWKANRMALEHAGLEQIEMANVCTACHSEDWFSHRLSGGKTGRFGALVAVG